MIKLIENNLNLYKPDRENYLMVHLLGTGIIDGMMI